MKNKYVILGVFLLFLTFFIVGRCSVSKTEKAVNSVNMERIRRNITDSLKNESRLKEIGKIDSMNSVSERKVSKLKTTIKNLESKLSSQEVIYQSDTASQSPICDSIQKTSHQVIDSLKSENMMLEEVNSGLKSKISIQQDQVSNYELSLDAANENINELSMRIKAQTNWWHRNEKWIFLGIGIIGTKLILK